MSSALTPEEISEALGILDIPLQGMSQEKARAILEGLVVALAVLNIRQQKKSEVEA